MERLVTTNVAHLERVAGARADIQRYFFIFRKLRGDGVRPLIAEHPDVPADILPFYIAPNLKHCRIKRHPQLFVEHLFFSFVFQPLCFHPFTHFVMPLITYEESV